MSNFDTVSTSVESLHLAEDFETVDNWLQKIINSGGVLTAASLESAPWLVKLFKLEKIDLKDKKNLPTANEVLAQISAYRRLVKALPRVEITTAFEPDLAFRKTLASQTAKLVKGNFILRISTDKSLIAGCILNLEGMYHDFSLRKKLTDQAENILGPILKEVLASNKS